MTSLIYKAGQHIRPVRVIRPVAENGWFVYQTNQSTDAATSSTRVEINTVAATKIKNHSCRRFINGRGHENFARQRRASS